MIPVEYYVASETMDLAKVQIKPLAGESEWQVWKYRIKFILKSHTGALEVVQGKLVKPNVRDAEATDAAVRTKYEKDEKEYQKGNNSAMIILTNSMTEETLQKVMRFESAREIWLELHTLYEASSENQLYNICMQFFQFKWNDNENIASHLSKLKNLWNELNSGLQNKKEPTLPELLLNCKILDILPTEYVSFKSSWLLLGEDKRTIDELTTQLCSYEREFKNHEKNANATEQQALLAKDKKSKQTPFPHRKSSSSCNYCHKKGHWVRSCPKWMADGKPSKPNPDPRKTGASCAATTLCLLSVDEEVFASETISDSWYIDNGASRHITMNDKNFIAFEKFESPHGITAANGKVLPALGKGTLQIVTIVNNKKQFKELKDVWYVPDISKNLFSVLAAQDRNRESLFESTYTECHLTINGEKVLQGKRTAGGGLYKAAMEVLVPETQADVNMTVHKDSILQLYHERWGHQDKQHIKSIVEKELNIKIKPNNDLCEACTFGKAHRLKFGTRQKATKAGELITTDVCGPFDESFRKFKYFVTFKDAYTKFRYCFFLKHKSEVKDVLEEFILHAKNLGHNIKEILSDNGGEFDNQEVRKILKKYGISPRPTAPYTPEQNGNSERENRTIVEMARTLKYSNEDAEFPAYLWAELISTSIYVLNRTGKSSVQGSSPYELWMNKKPRINHMRIIGSVCYAHIPVQKRKKMDKKATKGYLVGYDGNERYRIYIKETGTVICSRDVIFEEKPSTTKEFMTLPMQQVPEEDLPQNGDAEIETTQPIEKEIEDTQPKATRSGRQIVAPKWTKDYIMSHEEDENSHVVNKVIDDEDAQQI